MDFYNCTHRGTVTGSAHSSCGFLRSLAPDSDKIDLLESTIALGMAEMKINQEPVVTLNPHGVKNGWASWPLDFDPVWVDTCQEYNPRIKKFEKVK